MTVFPDALRRLSAFLARHRPALLLVAAVGFGALAVFGVRGYLAERLALEKARLTPVQATIDVVVARHDLGAGVPVDATNMAIRPVPVDFVPGGVVLPDGFDAHVGARLAQPMRSGEPLLSTSLLGVDRGTFSSRIRPGIRAMSVLVDEVNSVSGMLQPGDRIDLLFTVRPPEVAGGGRAQEVTSTLLQNVEVLATGRQVRADAGGAAAGTGGPGAADIRRHFTAITVEVSPLQAQQLIVAQRTGKLTAMLRNPDDLQPLPARAMDLNALLGIEPAPPVPVAIRPRGPEIIVGGRGALVASRLSVMPPPTGEMGARAPAGAQYAQAAPVGLVIGEPSSGATEETMPPAGESPGWTLHSFSRATLPAPDHLFADKQMRSVQGVPIDAEARQ